MQLRNKVIELMFTPKRKSDQIELENGDSKLVKTMNNRRPEPETTPGVVKVMLVAMKVLFDRKLRTREKLTKREMENFWRSKRTLRFSWNLYNS